MGDQMLFPDTVEEFMEQYKIVDTKQIYTNGTEMVPIFRMKQWFEHKPEPNYCRDCEWSWCHINVDKHGKTEIYWCWNWEDETKEEGYCHKWKKRTRGEEQ